MLAIIAVLGLAGWLIWARDTDSPDAANHKDGSSTSKTAGESTTSSEAGTKPTTSDSSDRSKQQQLDRKDTSAFTCNSVFSIRHPKNLTATVTDDSQCLVSNTTRDAFPPVGPVNPDQIGLFIDIQPTSFKTAKAYLDDFIKAANKDHPMEVQSTESFKLDNGDTALLARTYGGHPVKYTGYSFVYVTQGKAITTTYGKNTKHKQLIDSMLRTIDM